MHGELVNAVRTAARCQMCVLERAWRNGKPIFIKILRNDRRMSCTEPARSHGICQGQIRSVGFSLLNPRFLLSGAVSTEGLIQRFSVLQR